MITIKINKDYRNFKSGDIFNLDVSPDYILIIIGKTGLGKSSLLRGIRGIKDSLESINLKDFDKMDSSNNKSAYLDFKKNATIEGIEQFDEIFSLDRITDDPNSFELASTAVGLIQGGGVHTNRMSGGQKSLYIFSNFIYKVKKVHKENNTSLVMLDEIDFGLDINSQKIYLKSIYKGFNNILNNPSIIVVTHNLLTPLYFKDKIKIYDMDLKDYFSNPYEWFNLKTGLQING